VKPNQARRSPARRRSRHNPTQIWRGRRPRRGRTRDRRRHSPRPSFAHSRAARFDGSGGKLRPSRRRSTPRSKRSEATSLSKRWSVRHCRCVTTNLDAARSLTRRSRDRQLAWCEQPSTRTDLVLASPSLRSGLQFCGAPRAQHGARASSLPSLRNLLPEPERWRVPRALSRLVSGGAVSSPRSFQPPVTSAQRTPAFSPAGARASSTGARLLGGSAHVGVDIVYTPVTRPVARPGRRTDRRTRIQRVPVTLRIAARKRDANDLRPEPTWS
jgi:hypothetical protein